MTSYPERTLDEALELDLHRVTVDTAEIYPLAGVYSFGKGLFAREPLRGSDTSYKTLNLLREGVFVLSRLKAFEGAVAVVPQALEGFHLSQEFPTFRPRDGIDPRYLHYIAQWPEFWNRLARNSKGLGSRRERVHPEQLLSISVPLPDGSEQRRISTRLDRLFSRLQRGHELVSKSTALEDALVESLLGSLFDRADWPAQSVKGFATVTRGRGPRYLAETEVYAVNQACVRWDRIDMTAAREVDPTWDESISSELRVQLRDVLVNSTGEGTIGRAVVAQTDGIGRPFDSHVLAVRTNREVIRPEFLAMFLRSPQGKFAVEESKGANTTKQTELGKGKLERINVPVPPLPSQNRTIAEYESLKFKVDEARSSVRSAFKAWEALPMSILNYAFSGQL